MINTLLLISSIALAQTGEELYNTRGCASCHEMQIAGCPDLTTMKEDGKIAGVLDVTAENISKWLENPQAVKPGTAMPPSGLNAEQRLTLANWLIDKKASGVTVAPPPSSVRPEPKLAYAQVAYPIAGLWAFCMVAFFSLISRLGPKDES
jgi:cytochrome c oxidase subunit 2